MAGYEQLSRDELLAALAGRDRLIGELRERVARLERLVSRNSGNSSMPPSSDDLPGKKPPERKPRRGGGQRKPGKQPGAPGAFLSWNDQPDKTVPHFPQGPCACGKDLAEARDLGARYSHQVTDLPETRAETTQHDRHEVECCCGRRHVADAPPEAAGTPGTVTCGLNFQAWCVFLMVMHHVPVERCADILESMSGARPSDGWVHALLGRAARAAAAANKTIRALIILARVVCGDETPIRSGPRTKKKYLHVACTNLLTYYFLGDRDLASFRTFVYSDLHGTVIVHDRYQNYDKFDGVQHQLCTAHLLRDLQDAAQAYPDAIWPGQAADALRALIHQANLARDQGPGRRPRRPHRQRPQAVPERRERRAVRDPPRPRLEREAAPGPATAGMPQAPRGRRPAVPRRHRHPRDEQPPNATRGQRNPSRRSAAVSARSTSPGTGTPSAATPPPPPSTATTSSPPSATPSPGTPGYHPSPPAPEPRPKPITHSDSAVTQQRGPGDLNAYRPNCLRGSFIHYRKRHSATPCQLARSMSSHETRSVFNGIWTRDTRPLLNFTVLTRGQNGYRIARHPRPQNPVTLSKMWWTNCGDGGTGGSSWLHGRSAPEIGGRIPGPPGSVVAHVLLPCLGATLGAARTNNLGTIRTRADD